MSDTKANTVSKILQDITELNGYNKIVRLGLSREQDQLHINYSDTALTY